jgi:hypothetical protein
VHTSVTAAHALRAWLASEQDSALQHSTTQRAITTAVTPRYLVGIRVQRGSERHCELFVCGGNCMCVDPQCHRSVRMPEAAGDGAHVVAVRNRRGRGPVTKIVETPAFIDTGRLARTTPPPSDAVRVRRVERQREHVRTYRRTFRALCLEQFGRRFVEPQHTSIAGLRRRVDDRRFPTFAVADDDRAAVHAQLLRTGIEVIPAQCGDLSTTQSAERGETQRKTPAASIACAASMTARTSSAVMDSRTAARGFRRRAIAATFVCTQPQRTAWASAARSAACRPRMVAGASPFRRRLACHRSTSAMSRRAIAMEPIELASMNAARLA